jgi:hypothetical protein
MKKYIALATITSAFLFAGKNVVPTSSEPIPITNPAPAMQNSISHSIDFKIGTLGAGFDLEHMFSKKNALRFNFNYFKYTKDNKDIGDVKYNAKLKLLTAGLLYDYHPWEGSFRVSIGAYYNKNKLTGSAKPAREQTVTYGGKTYSGNAIDHIDAKIDFKKFAPYVGIGWSSTQSHGWHFVADIGVLYVGSPKIYSKAYATNPAIQTDLDNHVEKERQKIYKDVKKFKWWPVISIGIQKKF